MEKGLKIFSYLPNPRVWKSIIVANYGGIDIEVLGDKPSNLVNWLWDYEAKLLTEKEKESIGAASIAYFVSTLFPLIDNFEMAMTQEKISKEVETFNNLMASVLESLQVTGIGEIGDDFAPSFHEAVEHTGEGESQKIEAVMRKGYLFQGNLIRPAMVKVKSE